MAVTSLAGRFAAKEALVKAFGGSGDMTWQDMEVVTNDLGAPSFALTGPAMAMAVARGISAVHLSISHEANAAVAFVVAEGPHPMTSGEEGTSR